MPKIGAHVSIAGGLPRAIDRAVASGCETFQIFTKSVGQWRARPIPPEERRAFRRRAKETGLRPIVAHNSYLINVAAADAALRARSIASLAEELDRAESLGLDALVMHPGSHASEAQGLSLIADALAGLLLSRRRGSTRILLEHTAGQGTNLGYRFEHLAAIIQNVGRTRRLGICLDTCHLVAAGYDITTPDGYERTFDELDRVVGLGRLGLFHLNDSKRPCGSRVDRHEHIGKGCLGLPTFERLINDSRFADLPMVIETPKQEDATKPGQVDPLDEMNLATLRKLRRS
ncbi:MAG TPA: deoxyribonuclease IV [Vicinamibacterales bacterium]|jgi:deoxyribonuclease-4|nr:deoxyribonuclease IV [Vicinamibacterales bacterium]